MCVFHNLKKFEKLLWYLKKYEARLKKLMNTDYISHFKYLGNMGSLLCELQRYE